MGLLGKAFQEKDLLEIFRIYHTLKDRYKTAGSDTQYFVDVNEDEKSIISVFQGSHSLEDWMNDFNGIEKDFFVLNNKKIKGHSGFYNAYFSAKEFVKKDLDEAIKDHPDYQVYFFGHSLGAAVTQIAAVDFFMETGRKAKILTFGTPKVFTDDSLETVREAIEAIAEVDRSNDAVTWMPPWYTSNLAGHRDYRIGDFNVLHYADIKKYHNNYEDVNLYDEKPEVVKARLSEIAKVL